MKSVDYLILCVCYKCIVKLLKILSKLIDHLYLERDCPSQLPPYSLLYCHLPYCVRTLFLFIKLWLKVRIFFLLLQVRTYMWIHYNFINVIAFLLIIIAPVCMTIVIIVICLYITEITIIDPTSFF